MPQLLNLVTLVAPFAPNVPAFTAANAILEAARTFYGTVPALTEFVEVTTTNGVPDYSPVPTMADTEVTHILGVQRNPFDTLAYVEGVGRVETTGKPTRYTTLATRKVRLIPTPTSSESLYVEVALRPTLDATQLDDEAYAYDAEILKYGAIALLKAQPGTDWSANQDVPYFKQQFEILMNERRIELAHAHSNQPLTANTNNFL